MKLEEAKAFREVLAEDLREPAFRAEWERTRLARAVALRVIEYRVQAGISQTELARRVGVKQPAIARLEAGDHDPSLATLARLAQALGMEFHIDITPDSFGVSA
jgi:DNA-binding XRE family transcriptional regulator